MWRIGRTDTFLRTARRFLRRRPRVQPALTRTVKLLAEDPFQPSLRTHALSGKLKGLYAVSVTYQVRLLVQLGERERTITLVDIGHHDRVYQ